ncbi:MAG: hypothetical protein ACK5B9_03015 [Flavobacteriia bacterium]|jgi:hypothetical protein
MKNKQDLENELATLKQKYNVVRILEVYLDTDDETKVATLYLRKPDKTTRNMVNDLVGKNKTDKAIEACLKQLYIGGDALELVLNNDDAIASAESGVVELLAVQRANLKKN